MGSKRERVEGGLVKGDKLTRKVSDQLRLFSGLGKLILGKEFSSELPTSLTQQLKNLYKVSGVSYFVYYHCFLEVLRP